MFGKKKRGDAFVGVGGGGWYPNAKTFHDILIKIFQPAFPKFSLKLRLCENLKRYLLIVHFPERYKRKKVTRNYDKEFNTITGKLLCSM